MEKVADFLAHVFVHFFVEMLLHGPGYLLRRYLFERGRAEVSLRDTASFVVSVFFWCVVIALVWKST
jgi:hypothetical protein